MPPYRVARVHGKPRFGTWALPWFTKDDVPHALEKKWTVVFLLFFIHDEVVPTFITLFRVT